MKTGNAIWIFLIVISASAQTPSSLEIARTNGFLQLTWPGSTRELHLQSTSNLGATGDWKPTTNGTPLSVEPRKVVVPKSESQRFFRLRSEVDASTLDRKLMMGYQGWFGCAGDGSPVNRWVHWFRRQNPVATNLTVDFWPDVSEFEAGELYATSMTYSNGTPARLYSAFNSATVMRHFRWMKENGLDGVFLQRFSSELSDPAFFAFRNKVLYNVRTGAETNGRVFAVMYDISGQNPSTLVRTLTNDWAYLANILHVTNSPAYVRHHGKPVVAVWGFGFTDRPGSPSEARFIIDYFKTHGVTIMGGVPTYWRTLNNDSQTNADWVGVYRSFDIVSPWAVGRYGTPAEADNFKTRLIVPDLVETKRAGLEYMPVVFPGFSWRNLTGGKLNQIPRQGGAFYWRQVYNGISAGCTMIYGAMFDEVDEGTAMFKLAPTPAELPAQGEFVPLNIDGKVLPSDWYLRLAGEATEMLRRQIPLSSQVPITP
jgi:hypothetical protein